MSEEAEAPWDVRIENDGAWRFVKAAPAGGMRFRAHEAAALESLGDGCRVIEV